MAACCWSPAGHRRADAAGRRDPARRIRARRRASRTAGGDGAGRSRTRVFLLRGRQREAPSRVRRGPRRAARTPARGARSHCAAGFTSKPCRAGRPARRRNASSASSRASVPGTASPRTTARVPGLVEPATGACGSPASRCANTFNPSSNGISASRGASVACRLPFAVRRPPRRVRQLEWPSVGVCTAARAQRVLHAVHAMQRSHAVDDRLPFGFLDLAGEGHAPALDPHIDVARASDEPAQRRTHARRLARRSHRPRASPPAGRRSRRARLVGRPLCLRARIVRHFASACDRRVTDLRAPPPARRRIEEYMAAAPQATATARFNNGFEGFWSSWKHRRQYRNDRASSSCAARSVPGPTVAYTRPRCSLTTETTTA